MLELVGVYAIYDHPHPSGRSPTDVVGAMLANGNGAQVVQLRAKMARPRERRALAESLASLCAAASVPLIVNDDVDGSTIEIDGVTGVHVGQDDLAFDSLAALAERLRVRGGWLGVSTHDLDQVVRAQACGAHHLGFGPVFATGSKANPDPVVGIDGLAAACRAAEIPVVAIGGITVERAASCLAAGAVAFAVIGALGGSSLDEIAAEARRLRRASERAS